MALRLITAPTEEPVTLEEAKAHLRLEDDADDAHVEALIVAARQHIEEVCWRGLLTQTWELALPCFPREPIELPKGQVQGISYVHYTDTSGVTQTLDVGSYSLQPTPPAKLYKAYGITWPDTQSSTWDAVTVRYVVGWDSPDAMPVPLKQALLVIVTQLYEFRTVDVASSLAQVSFAVDALLGPYRLVRL